MKFHSRGRAGHEDATKPVMPGGVNGRDENVNAANMRNLVELRAPMNTLRQSHGRVVLTGQPWDETPARLYPGEARDHGPLAALSPPNACATSIIVPARDEAATLTDALTALMCQMDLAGRPVHHGLYEVIVLANNCRDATASVARAFAARHPGFEMHVVELTLAASDANIGTARRMLMDEACRRLLGNGRPSGVIASTDGDTVVAPTWLAAIHAEFAKGVDAVGGRILALPPEEADLDGPTRAYHLRDVTYQHLVAELESYLDPLPEDPWPRHHQFFGASLAVTASMYARVGGLPSVPVLEDMAFRRQLRRFDARLRHSPRVRVRTSARRTGRVEMGLSTQLREWSAMAAQGQPHLVESAAVVAGRARNRHRLRLLWERAATRTIRDDPALEIVARQIGVERDWLLRQLACQQTFGLLHERVLERGRPAVVGEPLVAVTVAIAELRRHLAPLRASCTPRSRATNQLRAREEIQPIAIFPPPKEMSQPPARERLFEEPIMDLITG